MATENINKAQLDALLDLAEAGIVVPVVNADGEEITTFVIE